MQYGFSSVIDSINSFLSISIFDNEIYKILTAFIVFFIVYFGFKFLMRHLHNAIKRYIKDKKENLAITILEIIRDLPVWFFFTLEIYIPIKILNLPSQIDYVVNIVFLFLVILELTISVIKILTFLI